MGQMECFQNDMVCIKSATKLMEQLNVCEKNRQVTQASVIKDMLLFGNDKIGMHLTVETPDGTVLLYNVEPAENLLKSISTGLTGHDIAAAPDADGKICLFSVKNDRLYYVQELAPSSGRFSQMKELSVTRPNSDCIIDSLLIHQLAEDKKSPFLVAVILKSKKEYWLDLLYWNVSTDVLFPVPVTTRCFTFSGDTRDELKLRVANYNYGVYDVTTAKVECSIPIKWSNNEPLGNSLTYISDKAFILHNSNDCMKISVLMEDGTGSECKLSELFSSKSIHCFQAWKNGDNIDFAVHTDMICHSTVTVSNGICKAGALNPLAVGASALKSMIYKNSAQLFYLTGEEQLLHRLEDMEGEGWNETTYEKPMPGSVTRMPCYSTELTVTDPKHKNVPLADVSIVLHSEYRTYVEIPDGIFMIDEENSVTLKTDSQGKTFFRQYTNSLDVPTIYAEVEKDLLGNGNELSFSQFSDIYDRIGQVNADTLLAAVQTDSKTSSTKPLIPDEYRTKDNAQQLASGLKQLLDSFSRSESKVMCLQSKSDRKNMLFKVNNKLPSWRIQFTDDGRVIYEELTPQEAEERIKNFGSIDGVTLPKWLTKIGDFFRSVAQSIVRVCEVVINGVKAAVKFVLNGIEMVFETVLEVVQDVLKFVEIIFAPLLVLFKQLFRWLASLLGWDYVLYTKKAIVGMIGLFMDWLPRNSGKISDFMIEKIGGFDQKVDEWIEKIIQSVIPDQSVMAYIEQNTPDENEQMTYEMSSNPLMAKLNQSYKYNFTPSVLFDDLQENGSIASLYETFHKFITKISTSNAFKETGEYISEAFSNIDNFFSFMLAGILTAIKELIHLMLSGCSDLVKEAFYVVGDLMTELKKIITEKIYFPLISEIYSWLSDEDMTLLDMSALLAAFPATITGKVLLGSVLFSSEEEADDFVNQLTKLFSVELTNAISGKEVLSDIPKKTQKKILVFLTCSAGLYGTINTMLDKNTVKQYMNEKVEFGFTIVSLIFEVCWVSFSFPLLSEYDKLSEEERNYAWVMWVYFLIGWVLDIGITAYTKKHIDAMPDGRIYTTCYGLLHLDLIVIGLLSKWTDYLSLLAELASALVESSRILINLAPGFGATAVVIDIIGALTIFALNVLDIVSVKDEGIYINQNAFA